MAARRPVALSRATPHDPLDLLIRELYADASVPEHALPDPDDIAATHVGLGLDPLEVVLPAAVDPLDPQDVLEPGGRDEDGRHASPLDDRVGGDRGAEDEVADVRAEDRGPFGRAPPTRRPEGWSGVELTLRIRISPTGPMATRSVKVPPVSIPTLQRLGSACVTSHAPSVCLCAGVPPRSAGSPPRPRRLLLWSDRYCQGQD